jgi:NAD(P)-dependent dehydrogenase (short-subunit alcohol dehydrogenase family)
MLAKTAIITGSQGNLGKVIVKKFIDGDYNVIGVVHQKQEQKKYNEKNVEEVILDLLQEENCQKFVGEVVLKHKVIDVAVLTAGGFAVGDIAKTKTSDIAKQYQLNFETAYNIARPVFLQMIAQGSGRIFFIGSRQGLNTLKGKGAVAYSLSKSLLFRLAEVLNAEATGKNVVVSVIVPSIIDTPQNRESMPGEDYGAWVLPSQIADIIYFYSSDEGNAIREPVIKVYGKS